MYKHNSTSSVISSGLRRAIKLFLEEPLHDFVQLSRGDFVRGRYFPSLPSLGRSIGRTANSPRVSYNKLDLRGGRGRRRGRGWSSLRRNRRVCVRRVAALSLAENSAWHGHEKFRRSRSTFARRSKNLFLFLSIFPPGIADGELGRRPSGPQRRAVSRAQPSPSADRQRAPLAEKKFFSRGLSRERRKPNRNPSRDSFTVTPTCPHRRRRFFS